jgi:hypothetical protein
VFFCGGTKWEELKFEADIYYLLKQMLMQQITLEIERNSDLQLLHLLAQRIGLRIVSPVEIPDTEREKYLQIIERGGDVSYIENPVAWQKEQRKDRDLPFRD